MKIEKSEIENKIILLYRLRCRWKLKSYKKKSVATETDFPCIYTISKSEGGEGRGVVGGYPSVAAYSRKISQVMVKW